jgi:hypothetical protein
MASSNMAVVVEDSCNRFWPLLLVFVDVILGRVSGVVVVVVEAAAAAAAVEEIDDVDAVDVDIHAFNVQYWQEHDTWLALVSDSLSALTKVVIDSSYCPFFT